jgi:holo-[acyl-carrier protein] synthase
MLSVGVDLIEIDAFAQAINKTTELKDRLFAPTELKERELVGDEGLAAWFAAKEAVMKAIWNHFNVVIEWHDVIITNGPTGQPFAVLSDALSDRLKGTEVNYITLSLSHLPPIAAAVAAVEFA